MSKQSAPLIVFEGVDGSGVSTQADLLAKKMRSIYPSVYLTKEPSDGPIGGPIRLVLAERLDGRKDALLSEKEKATTLALWFAADRIDHVYNSILPKLKAGIPVVCDRYYLSSYAYQGAFIGDMTYIETINAHVIKPDLTIFLDVKTAECQKRLSARGMHYELFDREKDMRIIYDNYQKAISYLKSKGDNIKIVDGNRPIEQVHGDIFEIVKSSYKPG